jgi:hypothetical protein
MTRLTFLFALPCLLAQDVQTPEPAAAPPSERPGIRRFSVGGVITFSGFRAMEKRSFSVTNGAYDTSPSGPRIAGGGMIQYAFAERFAAAAQILLRRAKFETNGTFTSGTLASSQDFSAADFLETPFTLRRFSRPHAEQGARWFLEGGVALRFARNIRSSLLTTDTASKTVCCDERPIKATQSPAAGVTFGAGYQLSDDFGLRLTPQIRYTRWLQSVFNQQSIRSRSDQIEAGLSITF